MNPAVHHPDDVVRRYEAAGYWDTETVPERVLRWAAWEPDRVAVVGERTLTYGELESEVARMAGALRELGAGRDDAVGVHLPNGVELLTVLLGLLQLGAVPILVVPSMGQREVCHVLRAGRASLLVVDRRALRGALLATARAARAAVPGLRTVAVVGPGGGGDLAGGDLAGGELDLRERAGAATPWRPARPVARPEHVAFFLLSGGTTGPPKLIPRTHRDYVYNLRISADCAQVDRGTVYLAALPVAHNFALGCPGVLGTLSAGGRVVLAPRPAPSCVLPLLAAERVTMTAAVPFVALDWCDAAEASAVRLPSLDVVQVGGARLYAEQAARVSAVLGCRVQQVYGMAEGLLCCTRLGDPPAVVADTQGRPLSRADELRIVDAAGVEVAPGAVGELQVRGPYTIRGYQAEPAVNAAAFTDDGFYRTGDMVRLHPSGNLVVEGRQKDTINRGGEKLSASEVESLLAPHTGIASCAVVGVPHARLGEQVCVFAVPRPGAEVTLGEVRELLRAQGLARFKLPEHLVIVDDLPLTAVGKVDRRALRGRFDESAPEGCIERPAGRIEQEVLPTMTTISAEARLITFINVFTCEPEDQEALVRTLERETDPFVRALPGFVSANIHRSVDGRRVVNYAQWTDPSAFQASLQTPRGQEMLAQVHRYAKAVDINLYHVASTHAPAEPVQKAS